MKINYNTNKRKINIPNNINALIEFQIWTHLKQQ